MKFKLLYRIRLRHCNFSILRNPYDLKLGSQ